MGVTVAENEKRECAVQSYCLVFVTGLLYSFTVRQNLQLELEKRAFNFDQEIGEAFL